MARNIDISKLPYFEKKMDIIDKYYQRVRQIREKCIILEVDESKFGNKKYGRGHVFDGVWVLRAVERIDSRRIIPKKWSQRNSETLISFLSLHVHHDSIIFTNC
ncbi:hypothetical protein DMUE_1678 [Dictyocoela muelleri]|nr:hypothetical protein DMUE_1678 [Dictyocoela muelleri]